MPDKDTQIKECIKKIEASLKEMSQIYGEKDTVLKQRIDAVVDKKEKAKESMDNDK